MGDSGVRVGSGRAEQRPLWRRFRQLLLLNCAPRGSVVPREGSAVLGVHPAEEHTHAHSGPAHRNSRQPRLVPCQAG